MAENDHAIWLQRCNDICELSRILLTYVRDLREDNRHGEAADWLALVGRNMEEFIYGDNRFRSAPRQYRHRRVYRSSPVRDRPLQYRPRWTVPSAYLEPYPLDNPGDGHAPDCPFATTSVLNGDNVGPPVVSQQPTQSYPVTTVITPSFARSWYGLQPSAGTTATSQVFSQTYPVPPPLPPPGRPWNDVQQRTDPPQVYTHNIPVGPPPPSARLWNDAQQRMEPPQVYNQTFPGVPPPPLPRAWNNTIPGPSNTVPELVFPRLPILTPLVPSQRTIPPNTGPRCPMQQNVAPATVPRAQTEQRVAPVTAPFAQTEQRVAPATAARAQTEHRAATAIVPCVQMEYRVAPETAPRGQSEQRMAPATAPRDQTEHRMAPATAPRDQTEQRMAPATAPREQTEQRMAPATAPRDQTEQRMAPGTAIKKRTKTRRRHHSNAYMLGNARDTQIIIPCASPYVGILLEEYTAPAAGATDEPSSTNAPTTTDASMTTDEPADDEQGESSSNARENVITPTIEDHNSADECSDHSIHELD
ncbi:uncharacterized protein LOC125771970 [Anopheles funestus]|uniref:uncharacterized protein LOC125771970 n=1 Tax=Anopheles funestus TaxID=62324 RepID=UPI0020C6E2BF|nr:uncharacterized protein LOC125771970 [Anopheles funestus]